MDPDAPRVSPATGSRRVHASQKHLRSLDDTCNVAYKALKRQLGRETTCTSAQQHVRDPGLPYRDLRLQREYDSFDPQQPTTFFLQASRSKVTEIVAADGLLFVLCQSGSCTAFNRISGRRLCNLNVQQDEVIRSLFYNRHLRCLIVVSVHGSDEYSTLTSRSIGNLCLWQGRPQDGTPVFDRLAYPSFVEFDDVNSKVLSYNAATRTYAVFDLHSYQALYAFSTFEARPNARASGSASCTAGSCYDRQAPAGGMSASNTAAQGSPALCVGDETPPMLHLGGGRIQDVKISRGMLLIIMEREPAAVAFLEYVPLRVHDITDGSVLKELRHPVMKGVKIELAELFNQALVFKQEGQPLQILDLLSVKVDALNVPDFPTPAAFIFLWERNCFLSLLRHSIGVWNLQGQQVTHFDDHSLLRPSSHASSVYINHGQDLIVSLCQPTGNSMAASANEADGRGCLGSIHISSLLTGCCVARVAAPPAPSAAEERATSAALCDMTALFLDEDQHEIYTGTADGLVHRWSR